MAVLDDLEGLRAQLHGMWESVAPAWGAHADYVERRGGHITERLLGLAAPGPGDRVLELACGPAAGGPGFASAGLVAPGGAVVVSDVAPGMVSLASERARVPALGNVTTRVLDLESIDEPDARFDVVFCREGIMLVPDPARAAREVRRVLRPGGRFALSVWGPRARNPWLGIVFQTVGDALGGPAVPPGVPHPFALDDAERVAALLGDAGLRDVAVEEVPTPYLASSADEWWARTVALAGPLQRRLAALPADTAQEIAERAKAAVGVFSQPDGSLDIPGVSLVATACA